MGKLFEKAVHYFWSQLWRGGGFLLLLISWLQKTHLSLRLVHHMCNQFLALNPLTPVWNTYHGFGFLGWVPTVNMWAIFIRLLLLVVSFESAYLFRFFFLSFFLFWWGGGGLVSLVYQLLKLKSFPLHWQTCQFLLIVLSLSLLYVIQCTQD